MKQYILNGKQPVLCEDFMQYAKWWETADRHVNKTDLPDGTQVSTVFLGLDHGYSHMNGEPPLVFETMIFGGEHDGYQERYSTWEEAESGHQKAVELIFGVESK